MRFKEYEIPEDVKYHNEHTWIRLEGSDTVVVGWTDFAQKLAGEMTSVMIPDEGDSLTMDKYMGSVETGKWVGKLFGPVTGEIVEVNHDVMDDPTVVNNDPYGEGWLMKVKLSDSGQLDRLLDATAYVKVMESKMRELGMD
jgi:glycine cleavage system H protein